jgi:hypothetical protein
MKMTLALIHDNNANRTAQPEAQIHRLIRMEQHFTVAERWMFGLVFAAVLASFAQHAQVADSFVARMPHWVAQFRQLFQPLA